MHYKTSLLFFLFYAKVASCVISNCTSEDQFHLESSEEHSTFFCQEIVSKDVEMSKKFELDNLHVKNTLKAIPVIDFTAELNGKSQKNNETVSVCMKMSQIDNGAKISKIRTQREYFEDKPSRTLERCQILKVGENMSISLPQVTKLFANRPAEIFITTITESTEEILFSINVKVRNISIELTKNVNVKVSKWSPSILRYDHDVESGKRQIRVHTTSKTDICSVVALQRITNKINIKETDITYESRWQTMLSLSVIDIEVGPNTFYPNGFFIVIVMTSYPNVCYDNDYDQRVNGVVRRNKNDTLSLGKLSQDRKIVNVKLTELENDLSIIYLSLKVVLIYFIMVVFGVIINWKFSLTGKVAQEIDDWKPCMPVLAIHRFIDKIISCLDFCQRFLASNFCKDDPSIDKSTTQQEKANKASKVTELHLEGLYIKRVRTNQVITDEQDSANIHSIDKGDDAIDGEKITEDKENSSDHSPDSSNPNTPETPVIEDDDKKISLLDLEAKDWSKLSGVIKLWDDPNEKIEVIPLMGSKKMIELRRNHNQTLDTMTGNWGPDIFAD